MHSSCGFNIALFKEYLSAVVSSSLDRNWLSLSVPQGGPPIPRCSLTLTKRKKIAPPSLYASLLAGTTGGELSKFFSSVKQLLISRGEKLTFFVGSETRDTGKRASPSRREKEGGEPMRFCCSSMAFFPPDRVVVAVAGGEIRSLRGKLSSAESRWTKGGDSNLQYEKRGLAFGVFQKEETTCSPVAGVKHSGSSCLAGSDSVAGGLKDASRHIGGLKALATTCWLQGF